MSRAVKTTLSAFCALLTALMIVTFIPFQRADAAEMKNADGLYFNEALTAAGAGSVTESLEYWQDFLESFSAGDYYLGTPYSEWLYAASPNGDKWQYREGYGDTLNQFGGTDEAGGMNCTGFVWHALMNSLAYVNGTTKQAVSAGVPNAGGFSDAGFTRKAWSGGRWYDFIQKYKVRYYEFSAKSDMLSSGVLRKGDIIWCVDGSVGTMMAGLAKPASYHHLGIYMGDGSSDLWWQSGPTKADGDLTDEKNSINPIYGCAKKNTYVVIPFGEAIGTDSAPLEYSPGDVNGDGLVDATDASLVLEAYVMSSTEGQNLLTEEQAEAADVAADGFVDSSDASAILDYYVYTSTGGEAGILEYIAENE